MYMTIMRFLVFFSDYRSVHISDIDIIRLSLTKQMFEEFNEYLSQDDISFKYYIGAPACIYDDYFKHMTTLYDMSFRPPAGAIFGKNTAFDIGIFEKHIQYILDYEKYQEHIHKYADFRITKEAKNEEIIEYSFHKYAEIRIPKINTKSNRFAGIYSYGIDEMVLLNMLYLCVTRPKKTYQIHLYKPWTDGFG